MAVQSGSQSNNRSSNAIISVSSLTGSPMDIGRFLEIALASARALAVLHDARNIHWHINPDNLWWDQPRQKILFSASNEAELAEPDTASQRSRSRLYSTDWAYMSPEQTGRMNRSVDYRTDMYSLGITFYELLTGFLPFKAGDLLEWVYYHIARSPRPPHEVLPAIPKVLSDIVMKLLDKAAENRYQNAHGLEKDLEKCLEQWQQSSNINAFTLGAFDQPDRLRTSQKLYGRAEDIQVLNRAFRRVSRGPCEVLFVSGYAGIGKTSLVHEVCQSVVRQGGLFIEGKFDQLKRNIPYNALIAAFKELTRHLLMGDQSTLDKWRADLLEALKTNGQVIIDVIPEIELIIGKQPEVPELGPEETRNRFNMVFQSFVKVFATRDHPLVLFLDDLQYADQASFKLLSTLLADTSTDYLLIIGAYRESEVTEYHQLKNAIQELKSSRLTFSSLVLKPLLHRDINEMLADMLGCSRDKSLPLAGLVMTSTQGNPFFALQVINRIYEEKLLWFERSQNRWVWDTEAIQHLGFSDNVVDLLTLKINEMSANARWLLSMASCIGARFDVDTLAAISGLPMNDCLESLEEAVKEGMLMHSRDFLELSPLWAREDELSYQFLHDRVQEAAYLVISPDQRRQVHFQLGRLLLDSSGEETRREKIFEIVDHLNRAIRLLPDKAAQLELAGLNLLAGQRAKSSTAYTPAVDYLETGISLMPEDSWPECYDLNYALHKELSECEYLAGNHEHAELLFDEILFNANSLIDKAEIYNMRIVLYATIGQFVKNNTLGLDALRMFGDEYPDIGDAAAIMQEFSRQYEVYQAMISGRSIPDLINLPPLDDPGKLVCSKIIMNMLSSAYISNPPLLALLGLKSVNALLKDGISPYSIYSIAVWGLLLGVRFQDYKTGYEFGQLALEFNKKYNYAATRSNIPFVIGNFIIHWRQHMRANMPYLAEGLEGGLEVGDFIYASYSGTALYRVMLSYGHHHLQYLLDETQKTWPFFKKIGNQPSLALQKMIKQTALHLMGRTPGYHSMNSEEYDEQLHLENMRKINYGTGIAIYYLYRTICLYTYEFFAEARDMGELARANRAFVVNSPQEVDIVFWHALSICACLDNLSAEQQLEHMNLLDEDLQQLQNWSAHCPENFFHKYALIRAEMAALRQDILEAETLFEQAIQSARDYEFLQCEALAMERASAFYRRRKMNLAADAYLRASRATYERWGAAGKVRHLDEHHPRLMDEIREAVAREIGEQVEKLDAVTVVKASQAISSEIMLSRLMEILMQTVIESAGAQRGLLVTLTGDEMAIAAEARLDSGGAVVTELGARPVTRELPEAILNYVRRSRETVILDNTLKDNPFAADAYFDDLDAMSLLCLPVMRQYDLVALLYLENNLVTGAFTSERVAVLELLAAQAAISLENASLYEERKSMEEELRTMNQRLGNIIEFLPDATIVVDHERRVIAWNRAIEDLTGIKKEAMLGRGRDAYARALYGVNRPILIDLLDLPNHEIEKSYSFVRRSEDIIMAELYLANIFGGRGAYITAVAAHLRDPDGNIVGAIESIRDISDSRQAGEERDQLRNLLTNIIDSMPSILVGTNREGMVTQWNAQAARISGISGDKALGRRIDEVLPLFKNRMERLQQAMEEQRVQREERVLIQTEDELQYVDVMIYPLIADLVQGAVVRVDDVTENVRLQEMMIQSEKMMSVGGLAAGMAHEINNPLSGIIQANQNIINRLSLEMAKNREAAEQCGTTLEAIRAYMEARQIFIFLEGIHASGVRAASIISNMLQFSRRSEARKKPVRLPEILERTFELAANDYDLRKGFDFRHIEIVRDYDDELPEVYCSVTEIEQVVLNLLKNSAHALGGVAGEGVPPRISIRTYRDDGMAVIEVEDNGPGMEEPIKRKIFEPFFTTKPAGEGTGLGLSVSYFIVTNNHNGQMLVDSNPGKGTKFTVKLPLDYEEQISSW